MKRVLVGGSVRSTAHVLGNTVLDELGEEMINHRQIYEDDARQR